jgi:CHASE3 domain sensor protein
MKLSIRRPVAIVAAWVMLWFTIPGSLRAQEQIVPQAQLHTELQKAAQTRQGNLADVQRLLSSEAARDAMKTSRLDPVLAQQAVAQLSDGELAKLAEMSRAAEADLAAGAMNTLFWVLAIIGGIVVLVFIIRAAT